MVVSVGVAGILSVIDFTGLHSADPMARKQAVMVAESLLEEVEAQAFTICDPDDANASTATAPPNPADPATRCVGTYQSVLGPTPGESRSSTTTPFDNVGDYDGFGMNNGITTVMGAPMPQLAGYNAQVTVANAAGPGTEFPSLPAGSALSITVKVDGAASASLTGYRFRYDPTASP